MNHVDERGATLVRSRMLAAAVCAFGLALTGAVAWWQDHANAQAAEARFVDTTQNVIDRLAERLRTYEFGLLGTRGMIMAGGAEAVTAERFERYTRSRSIAEEFPGTTGVAVVSRVAAGEEASFIAAQRRAGAPDFTLTQRSAHAGDRYVVGFVEPLAWNQGLQGVDLASVAEPRDAADAAMHSGKARLSAPFVGLDPRHPHEHGWLLLLPNYRAAAPTSTPAARDQALFGWTALSLHADRVLSGLALDSALIALAVRDRDARPQDAFYSNGTMPGSAAAGLARTVELPVYGRTWLVDLRARPAFATSLRQANPGMTLALGALLTLLAAGAAHRVGSAALRARRLGNERARLAAIVNSSSDAVIGETLDGLITDWNAAAERLFGHSAAEAVGRPLADLLAPAGHEAEHAWLRAETARGAMVPAFDTQRAHRDGHLIDVSVTASPIIAADGRIAGFAKTVRDIRRAKAAERAVNDLNERLEQRVAERTALLETARHDLRTIFDAMPTMIGYWDKDLRHRVTNQAYLDWFGVDADQIRDMRLPDLLGPDLFALNEAFIRAALGGEAQSFERSLTGRDGSGRRETMIHYLPDAIGGEVRGFYVLVHDVTELVAGRQRLATALRENEALLSTIHTHAIVSVADRAGRIVDANEGFCRISGYSREELLGQNHRIVNSGVQSPAFWRAMWGQIADGRPWRGEICNRAKDGSLYWVDSIIAPFADAEGRIDKYISIRFDITAAKRAEQDLRASEAFLDRAGDIARVGGWELDLRTMALTWSKQTCRIHDLPADHRPELARAIEYYAPEARPLMERVVRQAMADGTPWDIELPVITATGRRIWARAQGMADLEDGQPIRLVGAFQDITERRQAAEALNEANERLAIAASSADIGVWQYDPRSGNVQWDERMYQIYGLVPRSGPEEVNGLWASAVHPEDLPAATASMDAALRGEGTYDPEFRIVLPSGEVRHIKANAKVSRDAEGAALLITGVNIDITERKRAEIELVAASQLLSDVLKSASEVSMIATDRNLQITVFNEGAERLLGYAADEIVGRTTPILIHDADEVRERADELGRELGRPVEGGQVFIEPSTLTVPREWTYVRKNGSRVRVSLVVTSMRTADGELLGYLGVAHDVTKQREHETSLRHAIDRANQASLAKSQFLANMSHEIRTPMNAVIGMTYLLEQSALDAEQADTVDKLRIAAKSLMGLINDVLDLSQIEAGELAVEQAPFALRTVLLELNGLMSIQAQAKRIDFSIDADPQIPAALIGDANRLGQVLANLVTNAIKFTDDGRVRLTVRRIGGDEAAATVRLRFDVEDSGIGIDPAVQARLFSPFVQADASTKRRFGGTGLGLSIVKRVVTLMGGTVGLQSAPGQGSSFSVELAFAVAGEALLALPPAATACKGRALQGIRVLVTDDSEINLEVARRILELEGARTTLAANGQEAVDLLRARPDAFDVVLMDVQMPVLDGHEATRCIREDLGLAQLPVIALTAGALTSEHQRAEAAGMDDFVAKPFDAQGLVRTLLRHVEPIPAPRQPQAPAAESPPAATVWPEIEGIDMDDVRGRFDTDVALFRSMLRRLLREFGALDGDVGPPLGTDKQAMHALAGRMHKLKGSASLLGAKAISELAHHAEAACRADDAARARQWVRKLAVKLHRLDLASTAARDPQDTGTDAAGLLDASAALDPERLQELVELLQQQSMNALDCFNAIRPQLRQCLGHQAFERVSAQIDNLEFEEAAGLLAATAGREAADA